MRTIDGRCFCDPCENRTQEAYALDKRCLNCNQTCMVILRKGDQFSSSTDCPSCGVSWKWQDVANSFIDLGVRPKEPADV